MGGTASDGSPYPGLQQDLWSLVQEMAADPDPTPDHLRPIAYLRDAIARMEAALPPIAADVLMQDWEVVVQGRTVPLRSYETADARLETMLYIHGGGWSLGTLRGHDHACADLARDTGLRVVSIDYALAPEHPYPTALNECLAAVDHLRSGVSPLGAIPSLWLGGDSAGGNLALGAALKLRDADAPVSGLFLVYPATDPTCRAPSYTRHANAPYLSRTVMQRCWRDYLGGQIPDAYAAPTNLNGLPQAIILTAELDPLLDEGDAVASALLAAGTSVWHERADGLIHGFLRFRARSPASEAAFRRATAALKARL